MSACVCFSGFFVLFFLSLSLSFFLCPFLFLLPSLPPSRSLTPFFSLVFLLFLFFPSRVWFFGLIPCGRFDFICGAVDIGHTSGQEPLRHFRRRLSPVTMAKSDVGAGGFRVGVVSCPVAVFAPDVMQVLSQRISLARAVNYLAVCPDICTMARARIPQR